MNLFQVLLFCCYAGYINMLILLFLLSSTFSGFFVRCLIKKSILSAVNLMAHSNHVFGHLGILSIVLLKFCTCKLRMLLICQMDIHIKSCVAVSLMVVLNCYVTVLLLFLNSKTLHDFMNRLCGKNGRSTC